MNISREFFDIADDPAAYAEKWKAEHGGAVVGYLCSYTPEEIIVAAGALPFRILGSGNTVSLADEHLEGLSLEETYMSSRKELEGRLKRAVIDASALMAALLPNEPLKERAKGHLEELR